QAGPVGMIRKDETAVDAASAPRAAQLHPAGRESVGIAGKASQPWRRLRRRRSNYQGAFVFRGWNLPNAHRGGQLDVRRAVRLVNGFDGTMTDERTDSGIHTGEQALRFSKCITKQ